MTVLPEAAYPREAVATYVDSRPACNELVRSGLIDRVLADSFYLVDDPQRAVLDTVARAGLDFDAIYIASSTCHWLVEDAVKFGDSLSHHLRRNGSLRFFSGKGCNTATDALALGCEQIGAGRFDEVLVVSVDVCPASINRLQNYAFFSDHCVAVRLSATDGEHRVVSFRNGLAPYRSDDFSSQSDLVGEPDQEASSIDTTVLTLNCFDFVLRFKFGAAQLFSLLRPAPFLVHHFGADPFLSLRQIGRDLRVLIHVESPPRHVSQFFLVPTEGT